MISVKTLNLIDDIIVINKQYKNGRNNEATDGYAISSKTCSYHGDILFVSKNGAFPHFVHTLYNEEGFLIGEKINGKMNYYTKRYIYFDVMPNETKSKLRFCFKSLLKADEHGSYRYIPCDGNLIKIYPNFCVSPIMYNTFIGWEKIINYFKKCINLPFRIRENKIKILDELTMDRIINSKKFVLDLWFLIIGRGLDETLYEKYKTAFEDISLKIKKRSKYLQMLEWIELHWETQMGYKIKNY